MSENFPLADLTALRHEIHQHPELSGQESGTAKRIITFISQYQPDQTIEGIGGDGIVALWGSNKGTSVFIRAELDALPIAEINDIPYKSVNESGHKCGHDGHMTMVAGLAAYLQKNRPEKGSVGLLFQPAEETGEGAMRMLDDPKFHDLKPDYIYALHNLPGFPMGQIVIRKGVFASASKGLIIKIKGKTSHAAEPEKGQSPSQSVAKIISEIENAPQKLNDLKDFTLATVVHVKIGERAFGTTPGDAVVMATLRAYKDDDLKILEESVKNKCVNICKEQSMQCAFEETEVFSSTLNNIECVDVIKEASEQNNIEFTERVKPFRWSEDFGLFTQKFKGAMFGLGAGEKTPDLHNPDYDFPDQLLLTGMNMFKAIIQKHVN